MELTIILFLAITLLVSYCIEIIAKRIKIPSILLLLIVGIIFRLIADRFSFLQLDLMKIVPVVGTLGLILIVFEGGLELNYKREKRRLILRSFLTALLGFLLSAGVISIGLYIISNQPFRTALINGLPMAIISSAIAIPSAKFLAGVKREFIIYESVFSDIIGIIAFNYVLRYERVESSMFFSALGEVLAVVLLCLLFCGGILIMLKNNKHHVKHVMILASLVLVYSLGKVFHLPTLIVMLVFGLTLKNFHLLRHPFIVRHFMYENFDDDLKSLEQITQEGVFVVKTFFFILLGYMIDLATTITFINLGIVMILLIAIYGVRWLVLRLWERHLGGELYLAPRGLITILLFVTIPAHLSLPVVSMEMLLLLILFNSLIIPFAFVEKKDGKIFPVPRRQG